ncbi:hypothetical protein [Bradyrhizobium retamae]|uniref:Uncharacterized protein n=1 Tax=Bradyrhizobium retamae TaxID=1300035 RepID=A0A0R3MPR5_9BRAD|nr:hypothetical protein [Bradyrhizobium retamae]KRR21692.1 hypothetical protein CQ13_06475 [Bradyrhizobium retamae]
MPQFVLNDVPAPRSYDALSDFAKGYVEAMFFTNGDIGEENDEHRLNRLGVARLTRAAIADLAKDCAAFWQANEAHLTAAMELEPGSEGFRYGRNELNDERLGNLFWFARQGHGVGFTDDGHAACLEALQNAARAFGEAYCETWRGWIYHR